MTVHTLHVDIDRATYTALDACGDLEHALHDVHSRDEALDLQLRIGHVIDVLRTVALAAAHRVKELS